MIEAKLLFSSLEKTLKLWMTQPWNWHNISCPLFSNIHCKVPFWHIFWKTLFIVPLFLSKTWAPSHYLLYHFCLGQLIGFSYGHSALLFLLPTFKVWFVVKVWRREAFIIGHWWVWRREIEEEEQGHVGVGTCTRPHPNCSYMSLTIQTMKGKHSHFS